MRPSGKFRSAIAITVLAVALGAEGCGYRVVGRTNTLPPGAQTIAVPAFVNHTTTYRIEQILTESVVREFLARTSYRVVPEENGADLVLHGDVMGLNAGAVLFDPTTGVATTVVVTVNTRFTLQDRAGKILYQNNNLVFREPYQIAEICPVQPCPVTQTNPNTFFQEEGPALGRLSRDFAEQVVSDILENF